MSAISVSPELLAEAKNALDITWTDEAADQKLEGQIRRGIAYITEKTGVKATDFSGDSVNYRAQELLFNYLLYDRAGSLDQFKKNYQSDLVGLRVRNQIASTTTTGDEP